MRDGGRVWALVLAVLAGVGSACVEIEPGFGECLVGSHDCACTLGGGCDPGLFCAPEGVCEEFPGDDGTEGGPPSDFPLCPDEDWVELELVEDTFVLQGITIDLGATGERCGVDELPGLEFEVGPLDVDCEDLDFGGREKLWVARTGPGSAWLGRFGRPQTGGRVVEINDVVLEVVIDTEDAQTYAAQAFAVSGEYSDWAAGPGNGDPVMDGFTSFRYRSRPDVWPEESFFAGLAVDILSEVPDAEAGLVPLTLDDPQPVEDWLNDPGSPFPGVAVTVDTDQPFQFYLYAGESMMPPKAAVYGCVQ